MLSNFLTLIIALVLLVLGVGTYRKYKSIIQQHSNTEKETRAIILNRIEGLITDITEIKQELIETKEAIGINDSHTINKINDLSKAIKDIGNKLESIEQQVIANGVSINNLLPSSVVKEEQNGQEQEYREIFDPILGDTIKIPKFSKESNKEETKPLSSKEIKKKRK